MKSFLFSMLLVLEALAGHAQDIKIIHEGDNLSDHFTYLYPFFTDGVVLFKNGGSSIAKMNFNTFLCKMQFIESTGDTLVVSKPEEIDSIRLQDHSFFYNKGYYEVIAAFDSVTLTVLRKVSFDVVVTGALGIASHTVDVKSYDALISPKGSGKLVSKDDLSVREETDYFLIGKNGGILNANKSGFLKEFASDKKRIEAFLKSNKIDFSSQSDLEKLFHFCSLAIPHKQAA